MDRPEEIYKPGGPYGLGEFFFKFMKLHNNKTAQIIADTDEKDTHTSLLARSIRTAIKLRDADNIQPTDVIGVSTNNHINTPVPYIAAQFLGAIPVYFDFNLTFETTLQLVKQVNPKVIITSLEKLELVKKCLEEAKLFIKIIVFGDTGTEVGFSEYLAPQRGERDFKPVHIDDNTVTACIIFGSGTTGLPKAICLSHYALIKQRDLEKFVFLSKVEDKPQAVSFAGTSLHWVSAQSILIHGLITGVCRVIACSANYFLWDLIEKYKINFVLMCPYSADEFLSNRPKREVDMSSLLGITVGGLRMPKSLLDKIKKYLPNTRIICGYGQTECGIITMFNPFDPEELALQLKKPTSCGRIKNDYEWKIVDPESEKKLGPGEEGEIRIKTPCMMSGYYNADSSEAFDAEGYMRTGDIGYYDDDNCFYIVRRLKETFKYREFSFNPVLTEEVLLDHPAVKEAAVIPIPHELDGNHPMAVITLRSGYSVIPEEIEKFVEERVYIGQKLRAGVKIVDELPKTSTMKIKKHEVLEMVLNGTI